MSEHDVTAADGRTLRVSEEGDPAGVPVLCHHGMPGSRLLEPEDVARARTRGIRLIGYDRPGYGGSSRHEGRNIADCAADVRAIAGALGIRRLAVWGISGGGPHAAACAALLADLVPAVAVLASIAPYGAPKLDYFAGMGELNVEDTKLLLRDRIAARAKCEADRLEMLAGELDQMMEMLRTLLAPVDAAALTGELGAFLLAQTKQGLAPGADGWWDDAVALIADWGFGLSQIRTPVLLMHGREDRFVPFAHGEWLAQAIPGVETRLLDSDGHISLLTGHLDEVYDWLLARMD
ncbi:MAG TPA: alpha/beta fold hydrolase [Solirubrobacteraceae bacterium]|nr:alpha/beta fold hydrolase [Solirubrobacteraceae bacterium]